tara:strand:+ start:47 stop:250 length:204 start_codon:yes stop_codon:yes gene_type:complete
MSHESIHHPSETDECSCIDEDCQEIYCQAYNAFHDMAAVMPPEVMFRFLELAKEGVFDANSPTGEKE